MKVPKYWKKRNIAHTSKAIIKREKVIIKGVQKILGLGKYSTHLHILIKVYDLHLLRSGFWLSNICDVSMPLIHTYLKLHSKLFRDRMKRRQNKCLCKDHTHWATEWIIWGTYSLFLQNSISLDRRLIKEWMIGNSIKSILSCNHLRLGKAISPIGIKLKGWIKWQTYLNWGRILCYRHDTCELYLSAPRGAWPLAGA